jgi:fibronectin type 3 domain-containing protein
MAAGKKIKTGKSHALVIALGLLAFAQPLQSADLTIDEGVVIKFGEGTGLIVRDAIHAQKGVVFTSVRDDAVLGQAGTAAQTPSAGDWKGIKLEASAAPANVMLDGVTIRYGLDALDIRRTSPALKYLVITNAGTGIRARDGAAPQLDGLDLQNNNVAIEATGNAAPTVTRSQIQSNTVYGVLNQTPATIVQATGNWWGHTSGPQHPTKNAQGQGDPVSDGVEFGQWAAEVPLVAPSLSVAGNPAYTAVPTVTLNLFCGNAIEYRLAENGNFAGVAFQPMTTSTPFTVSDGDGIKQISVQYRASTGNLVSASLPQGLLFDTQGPSLNVTNPAAGAYINKSITISAEAFDPAGVAKVEFYINDALLSTDTTAPYSHYWDVTSVTNDMYSIKVVAYDTIGRSTSEIRSFNLTKDAPPPPDTSGPALGALKLDVSDLLEGTVVAKSGMVTLTATDPSGVSRLEFFINGVMFGTDSNAADGYGAYLDIVPLTDGANALTVKAYDSLNNASQSTVNIAVALAPPSAPAITQPKAGLTTNVKQIAVSGKAEKLTQVFIHSNGAVVAGPVNADGAGAFSATAPLSEGLNRLQASAQNRGGAGPLSAEVQVTLDSSIPVAPVGLSASALASGKLRLSWTKPADTTVTGYHVYRSPLSFTTTSEATRANTNLITATVFDDLPAIDGTYYYRVVAVNALGTASNPSNQASAIADSVAPKATSIEYAPTGKIDPTTGRMGVGRVNVTVKVSEPLSAVPFLSITPNAGVPIAIDLSRVSDLEYRGGFDITELTPTGTAYAVFSARDVVGNRGTEVAQGAAINIDAQGPSVTNIAVTPLDPIKNEAANPATVSAVFTLNEALKPGQVPEFGYTLSSTATTAVAIASVTQTSLYVWQATFTLPASAGQSAPETLQFAYRGVDDLNNVATKITAANSFQVYQGELPPLGVPANFAAVAQPGGRVGLSWGAVDGVVGYQLYRQVPGEADLTAYQRVAAGVEYTDGPLADGIYKYAITSIRSHNGQESQSDRSDPPVQVTADATAPAAPQNLTLKLTGSGIVAEWQASASGDVVSYSMYRSNASTITTVDGLTPVKSGIKALITLDSQPSLSEHAYAVTAVDAAGNQSVPSNSVYLNFALLPVSTIGVEQIDTGMPIVSWTHKGTTIAGYDIYLGPDSDKTKLNSQRLNSLAYTDTGYTGDERRYTVVAVDNNGAEMGRAIALPKLSSQLVAGTPIKRGLMNRLQYQVTNNGTAAVSNIRVKVKVESHDAASNAFSLAAGETKLISVIVGGFPDLPNLATMMTTIEVVPNEGEAARIVRNGNVDVLDGSLVLGIATETFTRGATGKVRFTLENTSDVDIEVITATQTGTAVSSEMRFKLLDKDNNVLATQAFKQVTGTGVVTLANGYTVARIPAGTTFTSALMDMVIPASAPDTVVVQIDIDKFHYHLGQADAVSIPGMSGRHTATLIETAYYGEVTSISPQSSYGDEDIVIAGRAMDRASGSALPNVPLKLIFRVNGFERKFDIFSDANGNYTYTFKPQAGDGGVFVVSVIHPSVLDRPNQGQFVINRLAINPATINVSIPRNYNQALNVRASAGSGTTATNVRLVYDAQYQPTGSLPSGVKVTLGAPTTLTSGQSANLPVTLSADNTAGATGAVVLAVLVDEFGTTPFAQVRINYSLSEAKPSLYVSPSFVETGVARDNSVIEQVMLENRGLAPAENISLTLLNTDSTPAPTWVYLTSPGSLGSLAVGEKRAVDIVVAPTSAITEGIYNFKLRIQGGNVSTAELQIYVSVTQSGTGNALFKLSDIYTATLDKNGQPIPGLAGARIQVQNELVLTVDQTLYTDGLGEAFFSNLPAGRYKFRATANNHQEVIGRLDIKPGVTASQSVFLDYNLISVQWSVNEITIQDTYEIVLTATYETDVPAAVVVVEPASVSLPVMQAGEVFYGEFTLTNYGLVRADDVKFAMPADDAYFRYEILTEIPANLAAKERITVPYRAVSVQSLEPSGSASGGGCYTYQKQSTCRWGYMCSNGQITSSSSSSSFTTTYACSTDGGSGGAGSGGSAGGGVSYIGVGGGVGGIILQGQTTSPTPTEVPGAKCIPKPFCEGTCCKGTGPGGPGPGR